MGIIDADFASNRKDYQNDNFLSFLKKLSFKFNIPSIHVAGTNGKGSTCNYLFNIYKKAGYKVGLFTSPYAYYINEMIKINEHQISDEDFYDIFNDVKKEVNKFSLSPFEIETYVALMYFAKNNCDLVIIECGMGGEFDATNIINNTLSIITSVSMEHTMFLGGSIGEIALHKAGIISKDSKVLIGDINEEARHAINEVAKEKKAKVVAVRELTNYRFNDNKAIFSYGDYSDLVISSGAYYSIRDASLAVEAVELLKDIFNVNKDDIYQGLIETYMPLRFERMKNHKNIIIDGAHNPEAMLALENSISQADIITPIHVIFACFRDKNISIMFPILNRISHDITLTTFDHVRARKEDEYFLFIDEYKYDNDYVKAIKEKIIEYPDDVILVTGSLAFAALVKAKFESGEFDE